MRTPSPVLAVLALAAAALLPARAAQFWALDNGDWSALTWYTDGTKTTVQPGSPGAADDIFIGSPSSTACTVAYDLAGKQTFSSITVNNSSTFGYKLTTGAADIRELHLTGNLSYPGGIHDYSALYIGATFQGSSIEAADSLKLIFDTTGAGLMIPEAGRVGMNIAGFSTANRNVEIAGAGAGVYGQVNTVASRRNMIFKNVDLHDLTLIKFGDTTTETGTKDVNGNYLHSMAPAFTGFQPVLGSTITVDANILEAVATGVYRPGSETISNHTITGLGGSGRGFDFDMGGNYGTHLDSNRVSGFDRGIYSLRRSDLTMENNEIDGNNYGLYWLFIGGEGSTNLESVGDKFGTHTPNATYDLYFDSLSNGPSRFSFDGTVLASDPDPLKELYFKFNNSQENWIAFRDFDGAVGDYRVWSSDDGLLWSQMVFPPRTTDILTIESQSAYSPVTPSKLTLDQSVTLAGVVLDPGTTLVPAGYTLNVGAVGGTGTLDMATAGGVLALSSDCTFTGSVPSSGGTLTKDGPGTLTLSGTAAFTAPVTVQGGVLEVNRTLDVAVSVIGGGTLGGIGPISGGVTVADGGTVAPGSSPATLTVSTLSLSDASILDFELGAPGEPQDLIVVTTAGGLTLDGILNVTDIGGFAKDTYTLLTYSGSLTDNGLQISSVPALGGEWVIDTSLAGEVRLMNIPEPTALGLLALGSLGLFRRRR